MKYNDVKACPTKDNIAQYVLQRLYFQGQPAKAYESGVHHGVHRVRSAIGHLVPTRVLRLIPPSADPAAVYRIVRERAPESAEIFARQNQPVIRELERLSRYKGKKTFRTVVREHPSFRWPYEIEEED